MGHKVECHERKDLEEKDRKMMYSDEEPFLTAEFTGRISVDDSLYHVDEETGRQGEEPIELDGALEADFTERLLKEIPANYRLDVLCSGIVAQLSVEFYNECVRKVEASYGK